MLPIKNRLLDDYDFRRVKRIGRVLSFPFFLIIFAPSKNPKSPPRFGFIFSSSFDKRAVVRNRHKRILRKCVEDNLERAKIGFDVVFVPKKSIIGKNYEEVGGLFNSLLPKIPVF